ncbi:extracellular solute-binding protein [Starkeya koreensis]|uniref:Extracellular solute-binding protein n=1 Tax=Ancylobacter koreensis TaxID=266121 RepID=A0ABT0DKC6_9HYPH|nr:extracellular solute-binding protein [Ancylobacter koreensis]MCK0207735.1 extracellular solute-binding protein [Ancylobacter koreensis]
MKRVKFGTSAAVLAFLAASPALAASDVCKGSDINILMETVPDTDALQAVKGDFEKEYGAKVNIEAVNYSLMHEKLVPSLTASTSSYDVLIVDSYWVGEFKTAGWIKDLDALIARDKVDTSLYFPALMALNGTVQGKTYMLPFWQYAMGILYRKDIVDDPAFQAAYKEQFKRDWRMPATLEEFAEVVKWAGKYKDMYGIAMAAQRADPVVMEATNYLFAEGGDFYDRTTWKPTMDTPEAAKAVTVYADLINSAAQPGALGANFDDVANTLKQGKAIFAISYLFLFPTLEDPKDSTVVGKMGFAPVPGKDSFLGAWGWAVPSNAKNPDCSWEFLKWVESKDVAYKRALAGGQPTQMWIYNDPEFIKKWPAMSQVGTALEHSKGLPIMSRSTQLVETFAEVMGSVLANNVPPATALADSQDKFGRLVKGDPLLK